MKIWFPNDFHKYQNASGGGIYLGIPSHPLVFFHFFHPEYVLISVL